MNTIWKFSLRPLGVTDVEMPTGSKVLTAQIQGQTICLWAQVSSEAKMKKRFFEVCATGEDLGDEPRIYIATVQTSGGRFIWHIYERISAIEALVIAGGF